MSYESGVRLFGLPLVHVAIGRLVDGGYRRGIARGWIAIGDVAFGPLLSIGGLAAGGITLGGVAVGVVPLGGLALGGAAIGGLAIGLVAVGGGAFGWVAALGGLAVASEYALGGAAIARHANDAAARQYFAAHQFFQAADHAMQYSIYLVFLPVIAAIIAWMWRLNRPPER